MVSLRFFAMSTMFTMRCTVIIVRPTKPLIVRVVSRQVHSKNTCSKAKTGERMTSTTDNFRMVPPRVLPFEYHANLAEGASQSIDSSG